MGGHPHKMSEDEIKAREAIAAGKADLAIAHGLLHMTEKLSGIQENLGQVSYQIHQAVNTIAEADTRGVVFVRPSPVADTWQATWQCGRSKRRTERSTKEEALRWAAEQPAGVRLFLNPENGEWETFVATAVLHGHYATGDDWF